ncbi:MAG: hypothetical protein R3Y29_08555 [bacterium]
MFENALQIPADKVDEEQIKELKAYCANQVKKLNTRGKTLVKRLDNSFNVIDLIDKGDQVITSIYLTDITNNPKFIMFSIKFKSTAYKEKFETVLTSDKSRDILSRVEKLKLDNKI